MKTQLDIIPLELKVQIYDMAKPLCIGCHKQFTNNRYVLRTKKPCECECCDDCILEALWMQTGCDCPGECDSFSCEGCQATIDVEIVEIMDG